MKYFIKKIITLIITLLFISLLTFTAFSVIPGDAAISKLGVDASPEAIARVRAEYELDQPVMTRYVHWLEKALHGDFGQSYKYDTMTVTQLLQSRLPVTILLAVMSFVIIVVIALPLGMLSARYAGGPERMHRVPDPSGCCGSASKDCDGCEVSSKFRIKRNEERLCQNGLQQRQLRQSGFIWPCSS